MGRRTGNDPEMKIACRTESLQHKFFIHGDLLEILFRRSHLAWLSKLHVRMSTQCRALDWHLRERLIFGGLRLDRQVQLFCTDFFGEWWILDWATFGLLGRRWRLRQTLTGDGLVISIF